MPTTSPHSLYGGQGRSLSRVRKLPVRSWTQFVKDILAHPQVLNVTRTQYASLDPERRSAAKRVNYVMPATFAEDGAQRLTANAVDIALVALDIDDPKQAAPFVSDPDTLNEALHPYAFAAYETASSTASKPKIRIFVAADHFAPKYYRQAVLMIGSRLGLLKITKESFVPVQPMYLPTIFAGEDPAEASPMLCAMLEGTAITKEDALAGGTLADSAASHDPDAIMHLKAGVDNATLADAKEALRHVDADCDRVEWLKIAAALKHQWPRGEEEDKAFKMFDKWSATGTKYEGEEDTRAMWDSLRPTPQGRDPVTLLSLFRKARDAGWSGSTEDFKQALKWLRDPERTVDELKNLGPAVIAKVKNASPVQVDQMLNELKNFLKAKDNPIGLPALKKAMRMARNRNVNPNARGDETKMPRWAQGLMYISDNNEFYHRLSKSRYTCEAFDNAYGMHLMGPDNEGSRPSCRPRDYLLNTLQISRVNNYRYDPSHPEDTIITENELRFVNLYLPTYPEPDPDDAMRAGAVMERHLENLIRESDYRRHLLDFMAYMVQHPGKKIRWAVLLQGAEGCGKTALARVMSAVLGSNNVANIDAGHLFSPYNPWAMGNQLVALEEVRVVGYNRHDVMNRLKSCISNNTVSINDKYNKLFETPNMTNYMLFSNHHDSLAVTKGDRRYFVLESRMQDREQVLELGEEYFNKLFKIIERHGAGLRSWLEDHRISRDFEANGRAPRTKYLDKLQEAASTPLTSAIQELLESNPEKQNVRVGRDVLELRHLRELLQQDSGLQHLNDQTVAGALRELGYMKTRRYGVEGYTVSLWVRRTAYPSHLKAVQDFKARVAGTNGSRLL